MIVLLLARLVIFNSINNGVYCIFEVWLTRDIKCIQNKSKKSILNSFNALYMNNTRW